MNRNLGKIEAKKSLGQHFLNNEHVPKLMADAAQVSEGDTVLEIGPGTGVLTRELLARGANVVAIEADRRAIESLEQSFEAEIMAQKLIIFHSDIRNDDLSVFGVSEHGYKVVANIPYYLSGRLFRTFLESNLQPSDLVFLVQKEVAERIVRDKKESLLSLSVKAYGEPAYIKTIKRGNFTPPPKIDSAIIAVSHISHKHFETVDERLFFKILHLGFASRRKQLLGNLSGEYDRALLMQIFSTCNLQHNVRGEDLSIEKWLNLTNEISLHI